MGVGVSLWARYPCTGLNAWRVEAQEVTDPALIQRVLAGQGLA